MLQFLSFVFLAVVFICSLINPLFSIPPEKFLAWIRSILLTPATTTTISSTISTTTASTSTKEEKKKKKKNNENGHDKVELEKIFATFDKNGDGFVTKQELGESLKNMGLFVSEEEVGSMVAGLDANGDGHIDLDEFCELYGSMERSRGGKNDEEKEKEDSNDDDDDDIDRDLKEAFDVFDGNGDGLITVEELGLVLSSMGLKQGVIGIQDCREMIRMVDMDGDGMVNFDEFKTMMMKKPTTSSPATSSS